MDVVAVLIAVFAGGITGVLLGALVCRFILAPLMDWMLK
jgi:hypothetical protein